MNTKSESALLAWMKQVTENLIVGVEPVALPELRAFEASLEDDGPSVAERQLAIVQDDLEKVRKGEVVTPKRESEPRVDPGEGWRLLEAVELPRKGDSWTSPHVVGWHQLADDEDGFRCPDISYRRRVQTEKQPPPAVEPHKNQGELSHDLRGNEPTHIYSVALTLADVMHTKHFISKYEFDHPLIGYLLSRLLQTEKQATPAPLTPSNPKTKSIQLHKGDEGEKKVEGES